jgi:hypothetical protein
MELLKQFAQGEWAAFEAEARSGNPSAKSSAG